MCVGDVAAIDEPFNMERGLALVTGITGQDGSFLTELLLAKGYIVHGIKRPGGKLTNIDRFVSAPKMFRRAFFLHEVDITDGGELERILKEVRPDEIYHLAGQSHPGRSFDTPELTRHQVGDATAVLLEIAHAVVPRTRFFHASSAEIFGNTVEVPQFETTAFSPATPYGEAKAYATQEARRFRESRGFFVCNGILYNHESPRRGENFVTRKIALGAARIARGLDSELVLGRLESRRDWGRAQDYVRAMWMMLQHPMADDYIVATGETHSVRDFLQKAFSVVGLPWENYVKYDPSLSRSADPQLVGCAHKIRATLGWQPTGTFDQLVQEMVEAELRKIDTGVPTDKGGAKH